MTMSASAPDGELAERLARCYTGVVYDVLRARGIVDCILPPTIVPLDRDMACAGPVFTVRGRPDATVSPHETLLRWTELLSRAPKGHVVMVEGHDSVRALMGELSAETLQCRGVRGYIVDGLGKIIFFAACSGCRHMNPPYLHLIHSHTQRYQQNVVNLSLI